MRVSNETKRVLRKCLVALIEIVLLAAVIYAAISLIHSISFADSNAKAYILCKPADYVYARAKPDRNSDATGRFDPCDEIYLDGKTKNGFAHIAYPSLDGDGWIYTGYIVFDEPKALHGQEAIVNSNAPLLVRKNIVGETVKRLTNGHELQVFYWSDEWAVTNYGFVSTEWIELVGEAR